MKNLFALVLGCVVLVGFIGCGGGGSSTPAPTPTPTPSQVFPNDTSTAQTAPVKLATSGGNANDLGTKVCCIGTLGSLWTKTGVTNPVILSNNHVLDRSGNGAAGEAINQPLQLVCTPPGSPAPLTVATLTQGAALKPTVNEPGQCPGSTAPLCGHAPSNVDAAIAEIVPGQVDLSGSLLDIGAVGTTSIAPAPPSSTLGVPALNEAVSKSGRTTGLTCSTIQSLNSTIQIDYDAKCGDTTPAFTALFVNQVTINGGSFSSSGDSGSLVVDTGTARAVALLYGGNTTSTVANPIQDVITAFGGPAAFKIVGAGDHAVSCAKTASAGSLQVGFAQSTLVPAERERVAAVHQRRAAAMMRDFSLSSVEIGASADNPREGALVLHVSGKSAPNVPAVVEGVRTRLVLDNANAQQPSVTAQQISSAIAVKEAHVGDFIGHPGIQGIGVSISADNPAETAISIYVIKGAAHPAIPATIDGVRTRVFEGERFKAY
ncbi:MAG TPA: hypothetical protein VFT65_00910 [Candidatus Angelobacter sp.]|nr:hypothetical protein [Candidatus Angelobacter sp.]